MTGKLSLPEYLDANDHRYCRVHPEVGGIPLSVIDPSKVDSYLLITSSIGLGSARTVFIFGKKVPTNPNAHMVEIINLEPDTPMMAHPDPALVNIVTNSPLSIAWGREPQSGEPNESKLFQRGEVISRLHRERKNAVDLTISLGLLEALYIPVTKNKD